MPLYNKKKIVNAIGNKGTLILSNQNAIHRGLPQQKNRKRIALVLHYMVISRLSYLHKTAKKNLRNVEKSSAKI